jgi:hypothetical protein
VAKCKSIQEKLKLQAKKDEEKKKAQTQLSDSKKKQDENLAGELMKMFGGPSLQKDSKEDLMEALRKK